MKVFSTVQRRYRVSGLTLKDVLLHDKGAAPLLAGFLVEG